MPKKNRKKECHLPPSDKQVGKLSFPSLKRKDGSSLFESTRTLRGVKEEKKKKKGGGGENANCPSCSSLLSVHSTANLTLYRWVFCSGIWQGKRKDVSCPHIEPRGVSKKRGMAFAHSP